MDENEIIEQPLNIMEAVELVIGEYVPLERTVEVDTTEVVVVDGAATEVPITESYTEYGFNWLWGASLLLLCLFIHGFLRAVGGMLKCKI